MATDPGTIHTFEATDIQGRPRTLAEFTGRVLLIVNVASRCGLTKQYSSLQALQDRFHDRGFDVLGFPCNQFGNQEPGSEDQIADFCTTSFRVSFPLFAKVEVNGADAHPLFRHLKAAAPGLLGSQGIKWNFTKFLVGRDGRAVRRYAPNVPPEAIAGEIERLLEMPPT
ncbi:glutathione peroxidase [Ectothiorhodospira lacustris]|uniref:glutathione peroxidase n=1 Tax=Ectothiorhodospira lacustris TaxID=2899127 RepID=UPI001EE84E52|nr:glutathione peroxidase [Ectothiorhodospira lacustris]MCG5499875.1 glutathione peroxidase [Ectothiorhodospira lacustris]MCG5509019.1 glutathione peroxidase [Ectothiorhodospira lacustris]MCG5520810.1 glutathione peroxidase [Ectothiorhodospira lacustris]